MNGKTLSAEHRRKTILSVTLAVICIIYVLPVLTVVVNSFKLNTFVKMSRPTPLPCPPGKCGPGFRTLSRA